VDRGTLETALERLERFPELSFFETLTLAAWLIFSRAGLDAVVLEVVLGGRWDATSIAPCLVAGLTNVGTDHARWLGTGRRAVAREKAAALANARIAVTGPGVDDDLKPLRAGLTTVEAAGLVQLEPAGERRVLADWGAGPVELELPLDGTHQRDNLHLALAMARAAVEPGLLPALDPAAVRRGLARLRWPGRLSVHTVAGRRVLLDGAHNREGAASLARHLAGHRPPYDLLFSCLEDKPVEEMAALLAPVTGQVAVVELDTGRAMPPERLLRAFPGALAAPDPLAALDLLPGPVVAAGSLRLVGALLEYAGTCHGATP
jgi:dihydrofolate synthase/folylpolyglutamate synthase